MNTAVAVTAPDHLPSPIRGISDAEWTAFVIAAATALPGAVSSSNALGMFEMKPRRLADLGVAKCVSGGRTGAFVATAFEPPMTREMFLSSKEAQYDAFRRSMIDYVDKLQQGSIPRPAVKGMTLSGALIVLHRCGPNGLHTWAESDHFPLTRAVYERCNGIF